MKSRRFVFLAVAIALVVGAGAGFAAHTLTGHKNKTASAPFTRDVARTTSGRVHLEHRLAHGDLQEGRAGSRDRHGLG